MSQLILRSSSYGSLLSAPSVASRSMLYGAISPSYLLALKPSTASQAIRHSSTMTGSSYVKRLTLFKIPKEEDIDAVLKQYEILRREAVKDGKPYIVSNTARRVINKESPLSEGFTLASQSIFKDREDHDFYDKSCPAHQELKKITSKVRTGIATIVTEGPEPKLPESKL